LVGLIEAHWSEIKKSDFLNEPLTFKKKKTPRRNHYQKILEATVSPSWATSY